MKLSAKEGKGKSIACATVPPQVEISLLFIQKMSGKALPSTSSSSSNSVSG